jgi:hypothetical protein
VGELDADHRALGFDEPGDPGQGPDVLVAPDAEVAVRDPPVPGDGVASTTTSATPSAALLPKCTRCQSSADPSAAMYWHMGDITIRLRSVIPRIASGLRRSISGTSRSWSVPAGQPRAAGFCA